MNLSSPPLASISLWLTALVVWGGAVTPEHLTAAETRCAVLEVFVKGDSERSVAARKHVDATYAGKPGIKVVYRDVDAKESDLNRYWKLAEHFKIEKPGLPAFYVSGLFDYGWEEATTPARLKEALTVEVFVRGDCPRCAQAKPYLQNTLAPQYPGYTFVFKDIVSDATARTRMQEVATKHRQAAAGVPALHYCGKFLVGWNDPVSTGKQWDDTLRAVTVPCTPAPESAPPAKTSRRDRDEGPRFHVPAWGGVAYASEPPLPPALDEPLPPSAESGPPAPSADAPPPALDGDGADAPPPRPRAIPEETAPADELPLPTSAGDSLDVVRLPLFGEVRWKDWGLPMFTIAVGLIDGFNPCAMWVLLFLLSVLVNLKDRAKILAVAGTFVFISGAAYYAFMATWLNVFLLVGMAKYAQIALGLLGITVGAIHIKDFFAFKKGISLSIPESAKTSVSQRVRRIVMAESLLGAIIGASILAVLVNIVELLCTAGLPAMYTSVLTMQQLPQWENYLYLLLYILAYMFDDSLMVGVVVVTLGKHRLQEQGGRILKLISGVVIAAIGILMLFKPEWLH